VPLFGSASSSDAHHVVGALCRRKKPGPGGFLSNAPCSVVLQQWRRCRAHRRRMMFPLAYQARQRSAFAISQGQAVEITVAGRPFAPAVPTLRLAWSGLGPTARVLHGGESFVASQKGCKNALAPAVGCAQRACARIGFRLPVAIGDGVQRHRHHAPATEALLRPKLPPCSQPQQRGSAQ